MKEKNLADFDLNGKVALITGAARGIGKSIAELFARNGADIIVVDQLFEVQEIRDLVINRNRSCLPIVSDITLKDAPRRIVEESINEYGRIDILVNNAGVAPIDNAEYLSEDNWDKTMAVNLKAPFLMSQCAGREMIRRKRGKIVNIASQAGIVALEKHVAYSSSKAGIIGMTKVLALEWARYNINVNAISPTVVLTELGREIWKGEAGEKMKSRIPKRRFVYTEEVATVALFLACDASNMITGANIIIDGGYTIQ